MVEPCPILRLEDPSPGALSPGQRAEVMEQLHAHGAILLQTPLADAAGFECLAAGLLGAPFPLIDNNSVRSRIEAHVYAASEYDPRLPIRLHTEYSYASRWPGVLAFACLEAPAEGGATTLGHSSGVAQRLEPGTIERFERHGGIHYRRTHHDGHGVGPSWAQAFGSDDRGEIERRCHARGISYTWNDDGSLSVGQIQPATRRHPRTGDRIWFNQVDQYFLQEYGSDVYGLLLELAGGDPARLPMHATFGDGSPIPLELIEAIRSAIDLSEQARPWQVGEVLLIDNMLVLHGRQRYEGRRRVVVYAAQPQGVT